MDATTLFYLALLGAAISALTAAIKKAMDTHYHRYLPLIPLILGAIGGLTTGLVPGETVGARVVWGVLAGAFSGQSYEAIKTIWGATKPQKEGT